MLCRHDVNGHMTYWLQTPAAAEEGALKYSSLRWVSFSSLVTLEIV